MFAQILSSAAHYLLGSLVALPQSIVATYGWPAVAVMIMAAYLGFKGTKKVTRPGLVAGVVAALLIAAWWFWPARSVVAAPGTLAAGGAHPGEQNSLAKAHTPKSAKTTKKKAKKRASNLVAPIPSLPLGSGYFTFPLPGGQPSIITPPVHPPKYGPGAAHAAPQDPVTGHSSVKSVPVAPSGKPLLLHAPASGTGQTGGQPAAVSKALSGQPTPAPAAVTQGSAAASAGPASKAVSASKSGRPKPKAPASQPRTAPAPASRANGQPDYSRIIARERAKHARWHQQSAAAAREVDIEMGRELARIIGGNGGQPAGHGQAHSPHGAGGNHHNGPVAHPGGMVTHPGIHY